MPPIRTSRDVDHESDPAIGMVKETHRDSPNGLFFIRPALLQAGVSRLPGWQDGRLASLREETLQNRRPAGNVDGLSKRIQSRPALTIPPLWAGKSFSAVQARGTAFAWRSLQRTRSSERAGGFQDEALSASTSDNDALPLPPRWSRRRFKPLTRTAGSSKLLSALGLVPDAGA